MRLRASTGCCRRRAHAARRNGAGLELRARSVAAGRSVELALEVLEARLELVYLIVTVDHALLLAAGHVQIFRKLWTRVLLGEVLGAAPHARSNF